MVSKTRDHIAKIRSDHVTIKFYQPHQAVVIGSAARYLKQLTLDSPINAERRIALGVCSGAVRFNRGAAEIEGGYVNAVKIALEFRGYVVHVVGVCWRQYDVPKEEGHLNIDQLCFAMCFEGSGRALIASRSFEQQIDLLEVFCKRLPNASIGVAVKNSAAARSIAELLSERVSQIVYTGLRESGDSSPQVSLIPVGGFVTRDRCDYFVALGDAATLNRTIQRTVSRWRNCIRIAIMETPLHLLRERDRVSVESMYGPFLLDISELPAGDPVYVAVVPTVGQRAKQSLRGLERKRRNITRNPRRNRQVARLASRIRNYDATSVRIAGIDDLHQIFPQPADPNRLRVAIVVESLHHASQLQRYLPTWSIVADLTSVGPFGIQQDSAIVPLPIACAVGLTTEVLVYAAGTGERWVDRCEGQMSLSGCMQLVVDFADDFDRIAEAEIFNRVDDYRSRHWIVHWRGHDGRPAS